MHHNKSCPADQTPTHYTHTHTLNTLMVLCSSVLIAWIKKPWLVYHRHLTSKLCPEASSALNVAISVD